MSSIRILAGCAIVALLAGCVPTDIADGLERNLPPCTDEGTVFASLDLDDVPEVYHGTVARVVDAHLQAGGAVERAPLQCTADSYRTLVQPSDELRFLAEQLPEWGPERAQTVSEADLGPVLLEYARVYECSLTRRARFLAIDIQDERSGAPLQRSDLTEEERRRAELIRRELATARPALDRTLAFIGTVDRLRPLSAEVECLKRTSLDMRNAMGLLAEAASCMPKIWDARASLRDLIP